MRLPFFLGFGTLSSNGFSNLRNRDMIIPPFGATSFSCGDWPILFKNPSIQEIPKLRIASQRTRPGLSLTFLCPPPTGSSLGPWARPPPGHSNGRHVPLTCVPQLLLFQLRSLFFAPFLSLLCVYSLNPACFTTASLLCTFVHLSKA